MDILKTAIVLLLCALVVDYQGMWADVYRYVMWFVAVIAFITSCALLSLHHFGKIPATTRKVLHNSTDVLTCLVLFVAHLVTMITVGATWLSLAYVATSVSWGVVLVVTYKEFKE